MGKVRLIAQHLQALTSFITVPRDRDINQMFVRSWWALAETQLKVEEMKRILIKPVLLHGCKGIPSTPTYFCFLFMRERRELTEFGIPTFSFCVWEDMGYIKEQKVILHYKYHSLHYGETSSRTGGDTGGGQDGDGQFGSPSSTRRFTCGSPWLLQVCGCFGSSDGIGHWGSSGDLYPIFFHVPANMQSGKKHLMALIESSYYHWCLLSMYACLSIINLSVYRKLHHWVTQKKST